MQTKTKKILWEIGFLVLLTIIIFRPAFVYFWHLIDHYQLNQNGLVFIYSILFLFLWSLAIIKFPLKNIYIKIAAFYPAILFLLLTWSMPLLMSLMVP